MEYLKKAYLNFYNLFLRDREYVNTCFLNIAPVITLTGKKYSRLLIHVFSSTYRQVDSNKIFAVLNYHLIRWHYHLIHGKSWNEWLAMRMIGERLGVKDLSGPRTYLQVGGEEAIQTWRISIHCGVKESDTIYRLMVKKLHSPRL